MAVQPQAGPSRPYATSLPPIRQPLHPETPTPIPAFLARILATHRPTPILPPSVPSASTSQSRLIQGSSPLLHNLSNGINGTSTTGTVSSNDTSGISTGTGVGVIIPPPKPLYLPPPAIPDIEEDLVPPENFALVTSGVYRCGFPKKRNFKFMETLGLKTILTLVLEDYPEANLKWCQSQDVQFMQFGIPGNKEPFDNIPEDVIASALCAILDKRNHPLLIHCNKGKHRTGCLVGCVRRTQSWSLTSIFDEYRRFSNPKSRAVDQQFIDLFDLSLVWEEVISSKGGGLDNLPHWPMLVIPRFVYQSRRQSDKSSTKVFENRTNDQEDGIPQTNQKSKTEVDQSSAVEIIVDGIS